MTRCHPLTPAIIETDDYHLEGILPAELDIMGNLHPGNKCPCTGSCGLHGFVFWRNAYWASCPVEIDALTFSIFFSCSSPLSVLTMLV
ncbi:hypothetical protein SKAU_G00412570 [Synaphobranchus kaupii]|uniref:Uncharacterized protein n=1 Tax=Synaphobranchus kaupii TaxID=118154 RepID=A0A9Q1E804_SYNKA|nr:hypothetical protein SKAU_G00412570 [Synaphobranchus kaupii]